MASDLWQFSIFSTVVERDVDLMVLEQLHCSQRFRLWLTEKLWARKIRNLSLEGAWCSISDTSDGESDLIYVVKIDHSNESVGLLIENKIKAPFQPNQQERYHRRGESGRKFGRWSEFRTAIMAPRRYIDSCDKSLFHAVLLYEELAEWFEGETADSYATFKANLIRQAIGQSAKPWVRIGDEAVTQFFVEYWQYLTDNFSELHYRRPGGDIPAGSVWPHLCEHELPTNVALIHKTEQSYVDLQFSGRALDWLKQRCPQPLPSGAYLAPSGRSSAIRIGIPRVIPKEGFRPQEEAVHVGLMAASSLIVWYRSHRAAFGA